MKIQVEEKDSKSFKLTVAKDRVSIKVPKSAEQTERDKIVKFLTSVAHNIGETEFTLRGTFRYNNGNITMKSGIANTIRKRYNIANG